MNLSEYIIRAKNDYDAVYVAGENAEYDKFWDIFQNYGKETGSNYNGAFSYTRFSDENYNPKYPIITMNATTASQVVFIYSVITNTKVPIKCLGNKMNQTFAYSGIVTIEELNVHEGVVFDRTFASCDSLENLTISGTIGQDIDLSSCKKLTQASIRSVIAHLSGNTTDKTLSLSLEAVDKAFETSVGANDGHLNALDWGGLIGTKRNWTISLI